MPESFTETGRKIIGIGLSYTHNWPNNDRPTPLPEPMTFTKPTSSYTSTGKVIEIPSGTEVLYEAELAVVIGKKGRDISESEADDYIAGYALALDMTASTVIVAARAKSYPWSTAKGFDTFTPISDFIPKSSIPDYRAVDLKFTLNGEVKQNGSTAGLIYTLGELISHVSGIMTLEPGDVILTGTPPGVGKVVAGDVVEASLAVDGKVLAELKLDVVARAKGNYHFVA